MSFTCDSPLKWPGGKHYLSGDIVEMMPEHTHFIDLYAGSFAVLFAKNPEGVSEVVNDINGYLTNFWKVLQEEQSFERFKRLCEATPFSQVEWREAESYRIEPDPVRRAWKFFIRCRQSMAGRMKSFAPLSKTRTRRKMNEQASAWLGAIEGLPEVHERLKGVVILNDDAINVLRREDGINTFAYLDPPYLHSTRVTTSEYGEFEMTPEQHQELLETLSVVKCKFLLSGYHSEMYDEFAKTHGWNCRELTIVNHASSQKSKPKMTECLWSNY